MKQHMMSHLPPSFSCSECDKKFLYSGDLNNHKKLHRGILIEICKLCNKGYVTKARLRDHIIQNHFEKLDCEVSGCSSSLSFKTNYKNHLKSVHKKDDQTFIGKLLEKLQKQKPNFQQLKYV